MSVKAKSHLNGVLGGTPGSGEAASWPRNLVCGIQFI